MWPTFGQRDDSTLHDQTFNKHGEAHSVDMLTLVNNIRTVGLVLLVLCICILAWDGARRRRTGTRRRSTVRPWVWSALLFWFAMLPAAFRVPNNTLFEQAAGGIAEAGESESAINDDGTQGATVAGDSSYVMPAVVADYLKQNHAGATVTYAGNDEGIDEVVLDDGTLLVFDSAGQLTMQSSLTEGGTSDKGRPGDEAGGEGGGGGSEGFFATHGYKPALTLPVHIVTGMAMAVAGPLLMNSALRNRNRRAHRVMGRAFIVSGILAGVLGTGMALVGPLTPFDRVMTSIVGAWLTISCGVALFYIRKRRVSSHRAWSIRAFAAALTISSHRLYLLVPAGLRFLPTGPGDGSDFYLTVITLLTAELIIRPPRLHGRASSQPVPVTAS